MELLVGVEPPGRFTRALPSGFEQHGWFGRQESNLDRVGQSHACCQLHHARSSMQFRRRDSNPGFRVQSAASCRWTTPEHVASMSALRLSQIVVSERMTGIEPVIRARQARVSPQHFIRKAHLSRHRAKQGQHGRKLSRAVFFRHLQRAARARKRRRPGNLSVRPAFMKRQ
jgi:hypothetical protein